MKKFLLDIIKSLIRRLAQKTIQKYDPGIIAITGSVGKTSTKMAIYSVLQGVRKVRVAHGNFNNEIGVPLTILGDWNESGGAWFWCKVIISSLWKLIIPSEYPEILILEYAIDRPGDMKYLLDIAKPQIGIITAIGDVPVHVEYFLNKDALIREKSRLIEYIPVHGFAILNADDSVVMNMKEHTRAHIMTFGFSEKSEVRITNFEHRYIDGKPVGVLFKLNYGGSFVPVRIDGIFSKAQIYACGAATAIGLMFGLNLVRIAENLQGYKAIRGRMNVVKGIKDTIILDDSYNAAPLAMWNAIQTLGEIKAKRRVAILGDMLEIGKYSLEVHEAIGERIAEYADYLITVGPRARFIGDSAIRHGLSEKKVVGFERAENAIEPVVDLIRKDDVILIKGSHSIGLERVVERISEVYNKTI